MKIETKFNENDDIFFIENRKVCNSVVRGIKIEVMAGQTIITYLCNKSGEDTNIHLKIFEQHGFPTKAELLKSL